MSPIVILGFKDSYGSWNITCILRRSGFNSFSASVVMSSPLKSMVPLVGSISLSSSLPVVVFPLPLSPAKPKTSPPFILKLIPSTARTNDCCLEIRLPKNPFLTGNHFFKSVTSIAMFSGMKIISSFPSQQDGMLHSGLRLVSMVEGPPFCIYP